MIASSVYKLIVAHLEITVTFVQDVVLSSNHTVSSLQFQLYILHPISFIFGTVILTSYVDGIVKSSHNVWSINSNELFVWMVPLKGFTYFSLYAVCTNPCAVF